MGTNSKRHPEIEPNIGPNLHVIEGGGESTPDRGNLQAISSPSEDIRNGENSRFGVIKGGGESTAERAKLRLASNKDDSNAENPFNFNHGENKKPQRLSLKNLRKKGPFAFVGGGLAGLFAIISFFGGPSMLLVHMSEIFGDALDQQNPVVEARYRKVTIAKLDKNTKGACSSVVSYRCKYGSFSERELKKFRQNGIEVLDSDGNPLLDENDKIKERGTRAASMSYKGEQIAAANYQRELRRNAGFRNANILSTNTKFMGLWDKKFRDYYGLMRASKASPYKGATSDEDRDKILTTTTKEGSSAARSSRSEVRTGCDQACVDEENKRADANNKLADEAQKNAFDNIRSASPGTFDKIARTANTVGFINDACTIPLAIDAVGMGSKVARNAQMVRYAATFLALASMIKAGDATPEDIAFAGTILTKTVYNSKTKQTSKSATDSFAFRNAAYGDKGVTESAGMALGAGGLGGSLQGIAGEIYDTIPGGKGTCDFTNNPLVQAGGILVSFIPGVKAGGALVGQGAKIAITAAMKKLLLNTGVTFAEGYAMSYLLSYIINIGMDIVSGSGANSKNMYGELAGDWIGSGTDETFSGANGMGGALPLSPDQAVALEGSNRQIASEQAQAVASITSPFDVYSSHSLFGSTYQSLLKSTGIINSTSSILAAPQRIFSTAIGGLNTRTTSAVSQSDYEQCEDYRYRDPSVNVATTPLCHVVRGIPAPYINLDPVAVSDILESRGEIDETGMPIGDDYKNFITQCFSNKVVGESGDNGDGNGCMIKKTDRQEEKDRKGYYAVHYVDERISDVAENGYPESSGTPSTGGGDFVAGTYNLLNAENFAAKSVSIAGSTCTRSSDPNCAKARSLNQSKIIIGETSYPQMDLIGTQETSPLQYRELRRNLPDYDGVPSDERNINRLSQQENGTSTVLWNKQKFKKISEGYAPALSNVATRENRGEITSPWVELETIDGSQKVFAISIHYPIAAFSDPRLGDKGTLRKGMGLTLKWAEEKAKLGTVIIMGDFNDHTPELTTYCGFTATGLFQNTKDLAEGRPATTPCPKPRPDFGIDHIYISTKSGITGSNWMHLPRLKSVSDSQKEKNRLVYQSSDHTPVTTSLSFPGANGTSGDFAWPVDKKFWDADKSDWLEAHFAGSGTWTSGVNSLAADISRPPDGTPVYAMFGGGVSKSTLSSREPHGLEITTKIQGGALQIAYAHGPRTNQKTTYKAGEKIMEIGCRGTCTGGHLHVDMAFNGKGVCPQDVFLAFDKGQVPDFNELTKKAAAPCGRS